MGSRAEMECVCGAFLAQEREGKSTFGLHAAGCAAAGPRKTDPLKSV